MSNSYYQTDGGGVSTSAKSYVKREADEESYNELKSGKVCWVLNSSQIGKTSLRFQIATRLEEFGVIAIQIDNNGINIDSSEVYYKQLVRRLSSYSPVSEQNVNKWWKQNQSDLPAVRFKNFVKEEILAKTTENIVIFFDEIGRLLDCEFPLDDFFGFIRSCHEKSKVDPKYKRLTFCLLGIASLDDLNSKLSSNSASLNFGTTILIKPFQISDNLEPLKEGLQERYSASQIDLITEEILGWTGGQPFLTHKLFYLMSKESEKKNKRNVDRVVRECIIVDWRGQDNPMHLRSIEEKIVENKYNYQILKLYRQISQGNKIIADNDRVKRQLLLSGIVKVEDNKLKVFNPIYEEVFNPNWIEAKFIEIFPFKDRLKSWRDSKCKEKIWLLNREKLKEVSEWEDVDLDIGYIRLFIDNSKIHIEAIETQQRAKEIELSELEFQVEQERKKKKESAKRNKKLKKILAGAAVLVLLLQWWVFKQSETLSNPDRMSSRIIEILYSDLNEYLKNGNYRKADETTAIIIWEEAKIAKIARITSEEAKTATEPGFDAEQAQEFSCEVLRDINELWTRHTNGDRGLSAQSLIWLEVDRDITKFVERVGWADVDRTPGKVEITFENKDNIDYSLEPPKGFFPFLAGYPEGDLDNRTAYLDRIVDCGL